MQNNNKKSIFILFAGSSLGNVRREIAIIEEMLKNDVNLYIFTWGKGLSYFQRFGPKSQRIHLISLISYSPDINFSYTIKMLVSMICFLPLFVLNSLYILKLALEIRPLLAILDSDYHFIPFKLLRVKIYFISHSKFIMEYGKNINLKKEFLFSYLLEQFDFWIQTKISTRVLSLTPPRFKYKIINSKFIPIPLIVQKNFLESNKEIGEGICILTGGSGIEKEYFKSYAKRKKVEMFGNKITNITISEIKKFKTIICQGGLSSLSELMCLQKKIVAIPIRGQWEQYLNCLYLDNIGILKKIDILNLERELTLNEINEYKLSEKVFYGAKYTENLIMDEISS